MTKNISGAKIWFYAKRTEERFKNKRLDPLKDFEQIRMLDWNERAPEQLSECITRLSNKGWQRQGWLRRAYYVIGKGLEIYQSHHQGGPLQFPLVESSSPGASAGPQSDGGDSA